MLAAAMPNGAARALTVAGVLSRLPRRVAAWRLQVS